MVLENDPRFQIILFTTPAERSKGLRLIRNFTDRVYLIPDELNLRAVSAIIRKLDVLITPDTSLVHIARSFKVDVVGLCSRYMENFLLWKPYGQDAGAVVSNNDDNIHDISPQSVYEAFLKVLQERGSLARI